MCLAASFNVQNIKIPKSSSQTHPFRVLAVILTYADARAYGLTQSRHSAIQLGPWNSSWGYSNAKMFNVCHKRI